MENIMEWAKNAQGLLDGFALWAKVALKAALKELNEIATSAGLEMWQLVAGVMLSMLCLMLLMFLGSLVLSALRMLFCSRLGLALMKFLVWMVSLYVVRQMFLAP